MKKTLCLAPLCLWLAVFVVFPLIIVVYYAFTSEDAGGIVLSLNNFSRFFDETYIKVFVRSIRVAFYATVVCLLLGYPVAYIIARGKIKHKEIALLMIMLPMWMNFLLRTYSWLSLLENSGLINSMLTAFGFSKVQFLYNEKAVIFGTVYNFLPFMITPIQSTLLKLDGSLLEAAGDLGANPVKSFLKITLPFSVPGIFSGIAMVFVPSVTTFVISQFMGGGNVPLIGDIIEKQFRLVNDWHFGSAISMVVMVIVLVFMYIINSGDDNEEGRGMY